jgi:peptidoglycan hydrolase CwlO-like protein
MKEFFLDWLPMIIFTGNLVVAWVAWSIRASARHEMTTVSSEIKKSLDDHDKRLQELELRHQYAPGHEDLQRLHDRVSDVKDRVTDVATEVQGAHADISGLKRLMEILVRHHIPEAGALQRGDKR